MNTSGTKTIRELAVEFPHAVRTFERLGIDYCCGGGKSLEEACASRNLSAEDVLKELASADTITSARPAERNWQAEPLTELIAHITSTHHKYTREEIARIGPLLDKVCSVHGANHAELLQIRNIFQALAEELSTHMMKEEKVLFPYIERMEEAVVQGDPILPPPFGSVRNPVAMMMHEHDSAGEALHSMRQASGDYTPPSDGCSSYRALYTALAELEADLHQHIHLENNILFPRAEEMEQGH
jgi:regulator of cell morphogenesis and NO signaling